MDFRTIVAALGTSITVRQAQSILRSVHGRGASGWVADNAGISQRTARRWLSSTPPRARTGAIRDLALQSVGAYGIAAAILRGVAEAGGVISIGKVDVAYDDQDEGSRSIGDLTVDAWMAEDLEAAASALEAGDLAGAADAFSDAILGGYEHGLEDTLTITDYSDGVAFDY